MPPGSILIPPGSLLVPLGSILVPWARFLSVPLGSIYVSPGSLLENKESQMHSLNTQLYFTTSSPYTSQQIISPAAQPASTSQQAQGKQPWPANAPVTLTDVVPDALGATNAPVTLPRSHQYMSQQIGSAGFAKRKQLHYKVHIPTQCSKRSFEFGFEIHPPTSTARRVSLLLHLSHLISHTHTFTI